MRKEAIAAMCVCALATFGATKLTAQTPTTVLVRESSLRAVKSRLAAHDTALAPAYRALIAAADRAMLMAPLSVTQKKMMPPSGNRHDYMSYAPYFWPDTT